ncbi:hypothetical protein JCM8097_002769 [Rhodosporidiobolus ruineniae]
MANLTDLPNELIDEIVALVYATNPKQYLGAVHRLFVPSARSLTFRHAEVTQCKCTPQALYAIVKKSYAVATSVRSLTLGTIQAAEDSDPDVRQYGEEDCLPMSVHELDALFIHLVNLEKLCVRSETLCDYVLNPNIPWAFRSLRSLAIRYGCRPERPNAFDPRRYTRMHEYPQLNTLELHFSPSFRSERAAYQPLLSQICHGRTWNLLQAVPCPSKVRAITLTTANALASSDTLAVLVRFTSLSSLELGKATFLPSHLSLLSRLPSLSRLVFGKDVELAVSDLVPLLPGPTKLPSLRHLRLDVVYEPFPGFVSLNPHAYYGWTPDFTMNGVGHLIDLAEKEDVELKGLAPALLRRERHSERMCCKPGGGRE